MKTVIQAGGKRARLRPCATVLPKPLPHVGAEPSTFRSEKPADQDISGAKYCKAGAVPTASAGDAALKPVRPAGEAHAKKIILIEPRLLVRECLTRALRAANVMNLAAFGNLEDALDEFAKGGDALFLLSVPGQDKISGHVQIIARIISETGAPVTVFGDGENLDEIVQMLELGVVGYISTDLAFDVVVKSLRLMRAGRKFVPASTLQAVRFTGRKAVFRQEQKYIH